jgi:hypothetical protein
MVVIASEDMLYDDRDDPYRSVKQWKLEMQPSKCLRRMKLHRAEHTQLVGVAVEDLAILCYCSPNGIQHSRVCI